MGSVVTKTTIFRVDAPNLRPFSDMEVGDKFVAGRSVAGRFDSLYVRIEQIFDDDRHASWNVIDLQNGSFGRFEASATVEPMNITIKMERANGEA